jgi:hypothetical protein
VNSTTGLGTVSEVGKPEDKTRARAEVSCVSADADRVAAFLASDPELDSRLPEIEAKIRAHFGAKTKIERTIFSPMDEGTPPMSFTSRWSRSSLRREDPPSEDPHQRAA